MTNTYKPDTQAFDEVRITTVPRYKESELSGDEWRISAKIEFMRNGNVVAEESSGSVENAAKFLPWFMAVAQDAGKGFFNGEPGYCDQEGCKEAPTTFYKVKKRYCDTCGTEESYATDGYRKFCDRHKRRGDCGIDDADRNYDEIPEPR